MVPVLYVIAVGLALWGVVVTLSGELVAMLDIATGLFGSAAIVAGLGAVAGALNRIARTMHRITVEAAETQEIPQVPILPDIEPSVLPSAVEVPPPAPVATGRERRREAKARRQTAAEPSEPGSLVAPAHAAPVAEEQLDSGAKVWVERREGAEAYAPRRRQPEPPPASRVDEQGQADPSTQIVRSGTLNGVLYRFFADGSVEAVTPTGLRRFRTMQDLREAVVAARGKSEGVRDEIVPAAEPAPGPDHLSALSRESVAEGEAVSDEAAGEAQTPQAAPESPEPEGDELSPERRLQLFQQNVWAATLAELRRPFDDARQARRDEEDEPGPDRAEGSR